MARVPLHFRSQLASEKTGVNSLDTSAADSARAISQMAGDFQRVAVEFEVKKRDDMMKSEGAKVKAQYANLYADAARKIKMDFATNPDEGFKALQEKEAEIRDTVLGGISNNKLKSDLGPVFEGLSAQQSVNSKTWQIGQLDMLDRQFLVDVQNLNVDTIVKGATEAEIEVMLSDDTFTEEHYTSVFGADGPKNFKTAKNAMFTARVTTLLEEGQFFAADDFIEKSPLADELTRQSANQSFLKAQKGALAKKFFQSTEAAAVDLLEAQENMLADDMTVGFLEDLVLRTSLEVAEETDPKLKAEKLKTAEIAANILDIKLESTLFSAAGNTKTEAALQANFGAMFVTEKDTGNKIRNPSLFLSDFLTFQKDVTEAAKRGEVSVGHYNKWMFWSRVALQDLDFKVKGRGQELVRNKNKAMISSLREFLTDNAKQSNEWKTTVLNEVYNLIPTGEEDNVTPETAKILFEHGKSIAQLQAIGLPVSVLGSKLIKTSAGAYPWAGNDQDGMPMVTIDAQELAR